MRSGLGIRLRGKNERSSTVNEEKLTAFINISLPRTFKLVRTGEESDLIKLIESLFNLHTNLQLTCLPVLARDLFVKNYIQAKQSEYSDETNEIYECWADKEDDYLYDLLGEPEDMSGREVSILQATREAIFTVIYEEQADLRKVYPTSNFLSIFASDGRLNSDYAEQLSNLEPVMSCNQNKANQDKITKIVKYFKEFLEIKGTLYGKLTPAEKALVDNSRIATLESFLKFLYDENRSKREDHNILMSLITNSDNDGIMLTPNSNLPSNTSTPNNTSTNTNISTLETSGGLWSSFGRMYNRLYSKKPTSTNTTINQPIPRRTSNVKEEDISNLNINLTSRKSGNFPATPPVRRSSNVKEEDLDFILVGLADGAATTPSHRRRNSFSRSLKLEDNRPKDSNLDTIDSTKVMPRRGSRAKDTEADRLAARKSATSIQEQKASTDSSNSSNKLHISRSGSGSLSPSKSSIPRTNSVTELANPDYLTQSDNLNSPKSGINSTSNSPRPNINSPKSTNSSPRPINNWALIECTAIAQDKWKYYSNREEQLFEQKFKYALENLSEEEESFRQDVRSQIFKVINDEQSEHAGPFYSIFSPVGLLNDDFYMDQLDARARARKENPFVDYKHIKTYCDLDVIGVHTGSASSASENGIDPTGIRANGSLIKKFCDDMMVYMQKFNYDSISDLAEKHLMLLQNQFCQSLANIHYLRGLINVIMKRINVNYRPASPRLLTGSDSFMNFAKEFRSELITIQTQTVIPANKNKPDDDEDTLVMQIKHLGDILVDSSKQLNLLVVELRSFSTLLKSRLPDLKESKSRRGSISRELSDTSLPKRASLSAELMLPCKPQRNSFTSRPQSNSSIPLNRTKSERISIRELSNISTLNLTSLNLPSSNPGTEPNSQANSPRMDGIGPKIDGINPYKFEQMYNCLAVAADDLKISGDLIVKDINGLPQ